LSVDEVVDRVMALLPAATAPDDDQIAP
jgi:hypothetical protein